MKEFESIGNSLKEHGVAIKKARYDEKILGSWFIELDSHPHIELYMTEEIKLLYWKK